jgi:hypothetical protein
MSFVEWNIPWIWRFKIATLLWRSNCISMCCSNAEPNPHSLPRFAFIIRSIEGNRFCSQINCIESIFSSEGLLKLISPCSAEYIFTIVLLHSNAIPSLPAIIYLVQAVIKRTNARLGLPESNDIQCGEMPLKDSISFCSLKTQAVIRYDIPTLLL